MNGSCKFDFESGSRNGSGHGATFAKIETAMARWQIYLVFLLLCVFSILVAKAFNYVRDRIYKDKVSPKAKKDRIYKDKVSPNANKERQDLQR